MTSPPFFKTEGTDLGWRAAGRYISWLPWIVFMISLSAAVWGYLASESELSLKARYRFDTRVDQIKTSVGDRLRVYEQLLRGARGLFAASKSVERGEWREYISSVDLGKNYPGIKGVGFVSYVPRPRLDEFLASTRVDGAPDFSVNPRGVRPEYFVITYMEPQSENAEIIGFDIATDSVSRLPAAEMSRDRARPTVSGKMTHADDPAGPPGFLFLLPVYRSGAVIETIEDRRAALQGWIYCRFDVRDLMRGILGGSGQDIAFEIHDGIEIVPENILYRTDPEPAVPSPPSRPTFVHATPVEVGERVWMLNFLTRPAFDEATDHTQSILVLLAGLLGSLLLFSITWSLVSTRLLAQAQAERMTAKLRQAQKDLMLAKDVAEGASRAKSEFLANMSHELRTPLNSLTGFANILLQNKGNSLQERELSYVDRILDNGKHLAGLINQVLDLSKVEAGQMDLEIEPIYLDMLVKETIGQMEGRVLGRGVKLQTDIPPVLAPIETDTTKLKQVLINLIGNAIKFTEKGSVTVRVTADLQSHRPVRIDVIDTGLGIPKDRQAVIFEPFQQGDRRIAHQYGGTGLGLSISRSLCQLMGYGIEVASEPGKGSTFSVVIPEETIGRRSAESELRGEMPAPEKGPPEPLSPAEKADFAGRTVLVIDDGPDSRLLVSHWLEDFGIRVISAGSGDRGLEMARERKPDIITLDLFMPEKNGDEILKALKTDARLKDIPVVIISSATDEMHGHIFSGVDALDKPVDREGLLRVLRKNLKPRR